MSAAAITLAVVPAPRRKPTANNGQWADVAHRLEPHPVGTWLRLGGIDPDDFGGARSAIVSACRRRGFRVAIRIVEGRLLVLRGRPLSIHDPTDTGDGPIITVRSSEGLEPYVASPGQRERVERGEAQVVRQGGRFYVIVAGL